MITVKMPEISGPAPVTAGKIAVKAGDIVRKGQELMQAEEGKSSRAVTAETDAVVREVLVREGQSYAPGTPLFILEQQEACPAPAAEVTAPDSPAEEDSCDVLVIGGGTGGYVAAIRAAKGGRKVILAEKDRLGGTCLNIGCIPTKTLIASAHRYEQALHADTFGISISGSITPDMPRIMARKDQVVQKLVTGVEYLMQKNGIQVLRGEAGFLDNTHVRLRGQEDRVISFRDCIIATGSLVSRPPIPGIDGPRVLDSTAALSLQVLPSCVTIVGGGVIGLEFAFLYRDLGAEVTVVEYLDRLVSMTDRDISGEILSIARRKGIRVELEARVTRFMETLNDRIVTVFEQDGQERSLSSDYVLVSVGRHPYTDGLGLENTDIRMNPRNRGIAADEYMRTSVPHIYAVGDVNDRIQLAHAASYQGIIAAEHILGCAGEPFDLPRIPSVIFTHPEIAFVGQGEEALKAQGIPCRTGRFHYSGNGKALSMDETEGFVKILSAEDGTLLGGSIIGADASTLIASLGVCIANRLKVQDLERTVFAHPTTAEVIHEAALDLTLGAFHE